MSVIRTKFVSKTIAASTATANAEAPADFVNIDDIRNAFVVSAVSTGNTAGVGRTTGTLNNSLLGVTATAQVVDTDTIQFNDGETSIARTNLCGAWLLEYTGAGGANEIVAHTPITTTIADTTATNDSTAISGITTLADVVPFTTARSNRNSAEPNNHLVRAEMVSSSGNKVRVTTGSNSGVKTALTHPTEFKGSNWGNQAITHTFSSADANEDETISAVVLENSWVYWTIENDGTQSVQHNAWVWLHDSTTLRFRIDGLTGTTKITAYVISNPQVTVTRYPQSAGSFVPPDTSTPYTEGVTAYPLLTTIPEVDLDSTIVLANMGSDTAASTNSPAGLWLTDFQDPTTIRSRRSESSGNTRYYYQVIEFADTADTRIESVTDVVEGEQYTVTGAWGTNPVFTISNETGTLSDEQTIDSDDGSTAVLTCVFTGRFGDEYTLTVTDDEGGEASETISIEPPDGTDYVNLVAPLMARDNRIQAQQSNDVAGGEQCVWSNVVGASQFLIYPNGVIEGVRTIPTVTADYYIHDGLVRGNTSTITVNDGTPAENLPPSFVGDAIPDITVPLLDSIAAIDLTAKFSTDDTLTYSWTDQATGGAITGNDTFRFTGYAEGVYPNQQIFAADTNFPAQVAQSNPFTITVTAQATPASGVLGREILLAPPTGGVATAVSQTQINLAWNPVVGASGYRVYQGGTLVASVASVTSDARTGLASGTLYSYTLATVDQHGHEGPQGSVFSATTFAAADVTPPTTPAISVTTNSGTQQTIALTVASTDSGTGVLNYQLQRATNSGFTVGLLTSTLTPSEFPHAVTGLTSGTLYFYRCRASDGAGNLSAYGTTVSASTSDTTAPTVPVISAAAVSSSAITVSLTTASTDTGSGLASYTLERATNSAFTANLVTEATGLGIFPRSVTGLSASTQYFFRARAADAAGNTSANSTSANATTQGSGTISPLDDWTNRSTAAGVTAAYEMSQAQITAGYTAGDRGNQSFADPVVNVGHGTALRMRSPSGTAGSLPAGQFAGVLNGSYGSNSTLYMSFFFRITAAMHSNLQENGGSWNSNWKIITVHKSGPPCQALEFTIVRPTGNSSYGHTAYKECGNSFNTATTSSAGRGATTPYLWQQNWVPPGSTQEATGYRSQYPNGPSWQMPINEWVEFYSKIKFATLGQSGSTVEVWVKHQNVPGRRKIIGWDGVFPYTNNTSDTMSWFLLMNYMTSNSGSTIATADAWYQDFIASTQPIAEPVATIPT